MTDSQPFRRVDNKQRLEMARQATEYDRPTDRQAVALTRGDNNPCK